MTTSRRPKAVATLFSHKIRIGAKLRQIRQQQGMTLRELAAVVRCSQSMISKIENDKAEPSLTTLHRIVIALGTNIAVLFGKGDVTTGIVMRAGQRPIIATGSEVEGKGVLLERLIPNDAHRMLQANIHIVPVGGGSEGILEHDGEEMGFVLDGTLELTVNGKLYLLHEGDSFVFRSEYSHGYTNSGPKTARVLWVNTPPTF